MVSSCSRLVLPQHPAGLPALLFSSHLAEWPYIYKVHLLKLAFSRVQDVLDQHGPLQVISQVLLQLQHHRISDYDYAIIIVMNP